MDRFVTLQEDGSCVTYPYPFGPGFGDPLLRNLYTVLDIDKFEVQLSHVSYTDECDVVAIRK